MQQFEPTPTRPAYLGFEDSKARLLKIETPRLIRRFIIEVIAEMQSQTY